MLKPKRGIQGLEVFSLTLNFFSAVSLILLNKTLLANLHFKFPFVLTLLHFGVTLIGIKTCFALGFVKRQPKPKDSIFHVCAFIQATYNPISNLSLQLNSVGTYQIAKLAVTPGLAATDVFLYGSSMSMRRLSTLGVILFGVFISTTKDVSFSFEGSLAALASIAFAVGLKDSMAWLQKKEKWQTLTLMNDILPYAMGWLFLFAVYFDSAVIHYPFTFTSVLLLLFSGLLAFVLNYSAFLVIGVCSPLTHQILGQLKTCVMLYVSAMLFGKEVSWLSIVGAAIAMIGIFGYTWVKLYEKNLKDERKQ